MSISEVIGMEGDNVVLEEIFRFQPDLQQPEYSKIQGNYVTTGLMQRSVLVDKAKFFGLHQQLDALFANAGKVA